MKKVGSLLAVLCLFTATSASHAETAYTDATAFNTAVAAHGLNFVVSLDSQDAGSDADAYGMLTMSADGLQSDGSTHNAVQPVATNAYSATSSPNSMGGSNSRNQFLAGNGDKIVFNLSYPVNAFGVRLIGNPSPTGDPAIPFWRMHANTGSGFDAYSAVEPLQTLSMGNDVYFLGIVSEESFNQVELYSDNDLAAVFSFNVDDMAVAADVNTLSLAQVKSSGSQAVVVSGIVVTRIHSDRFNVEANNRANGLAVLGNGATRGKEVSLFGEVQTTPDGERVLNLIHLINEQEPTTGIPAPLGMGGRAVGGGATECLQIGCDGSAGPNNIGLDVVIWGKITGIAPDYTWMTVDDGSDRENGTIYHGVMVSGDILAQDRHVGDHVRVQGSASLLLSGENHYPLVRVAQSSDVTGL
ncbi:MAG: hypothetical protein ABFD54_00285 [Armatimonadota bacterium]|nr:hypothetical protein [bacterium]